MFSTIDVQTRPFAGSSGWPGSPRIPSTALTVLPTRRLRAADEDHRRRAVPGDVGTGGVDDERAGPASLRNSSISFGPNSRFMNEFEVICPVQPAGRSPLAGLASWKNRSMNGTVSAYLPLQVA